MNLRRDDPRRTPEAAAKAREEARRRHEDHVLHRFQQDLTDTSAATAGQRTEEQHP